MLNVKANAIDRNMHSPLAGDGAMPPEPTDDGTGCYGFPATVEFSRVRGTQPMLSFCARIVASVVPPAVVMRLSAMRWMPRPNSWAFLAVRVRVLTPIQAISEESRP